MAILPKYENPSTAYTAAGHTTIGADTNGLLFKKSPSGAIDTLSIRDDIGCVNVKWYGAVGDGVANDSTAIQAAIDAATAAGGGKIIFPYGTYLCNVTLKSGVELVGLTGTLQYQAGANKSVTLRAAGAGPVIDTPVGSTIGAGVIGFNIVGLGSGIACQGIKFRDTTWCCVKSCGFDNFSDEAIIKIAGAACTFEDILAINSLLNRTRGTDSAVVDIGGTDDFLSRIEANTSLTGSSAGGKCYGLAVRTSSAFITNCIGEISDVGIWVSCNYSRFLNCRADHNWGHGFYLSAGTNQYTSCTAHNNSQNTTNTKSGFYVAISANQRNTFVNCRAISPGTNKHKYGFEDNTNSGDPSVGSRYVACESTEHATAAWLRDTYFPASIEHRNGYRYMNPSGTVTPDVSETQELWLDTGSATTVTNFTGGIQGQILYVRGGSTVTINHNPPYIRTNSGNNKTLRDHAFYTFRYHDGWIEVASSELNLGGYSYINPTGTVTPNVAGLTEIWMDTVSAASVTNFTGGVDGQVLYVRGGPNVTLVHNGTTISTNTYANKVMADHVYYCFRYRGGIWRELMN